MLLFVYYVLITWFGMGMLGWAAGRHYWKVVWGNPLHDPPLARLVVCAGPIGLFATLAFMWESRDDYRKAKSRSVL